MEETLSTATTSVSSFSPPPPPPQQQQQPVIMNMNMNMGINGGVTTTAPAPATTTTTTTTTITTTVSSGAAAATMAATTTPGGSEGGQGSGKKKRGRPRKYDSDGNLRLTCPPNAATTTVTFRSPPPGFTLSPSSPPPYSEFSSSKRGRGRSISTGSAGNWHFLSSFGEVFANSAGGDFTPHVLTVYAGEDVAGKILSFAQKGPRGICVLSANGAISNVTIRQPGSSGGLLTYEGRFEILSLSGSYTVSDNSGMRSRTGGLSVSLAGPDGRVIGGGVAGLLTAAGPIQLVVGSFMPHGYKTHKRKYHREHTVASPIAGGPETVTAARPISQAIPDGENFLIHTSQLPEQSQRESASVSSEKLNLDASPHGATATWNGSEEFSDQRISPDINISLPDE